jgi:hypothetical protein
MVTATPRVALTDPMLVRGWYLDVLISAAWTPVSGISEFKPTNAAVLKDTTTFDNAGSQSQTKTAAQWSIEGKLLRAPQQGTPASYDVGAEYLRTQSLLFGAANTVQVRYYEVNGDAGTQSSGGVRYPITEGWSGYATVEFNEDANSADDPRMIGFKLTGRGARTALSFNPASG